jgi:hypothetical protein
MIWSLPIQVVINGKKYNITNKCDYRVILDIIDIFNDEELETQDKVKLALIVFYEDITSCEDLETAVKEMMKIINVGEEDEGIEEEKNHKPKLMDWKHDFKLLAPPISRVLGYSVRDESNYTHWYDFVGAYMEIGECNFSNIVSIRSKRAKGKKLESWEQEFYLENKKQIDLPHTLTEEEREWLESDW